MTLWLLRRHCWDLPQFSPKSRLPPLGHLILYALESYIFSRIRILINSGELCEHSCQDLESLRILNFVWYFWPTFMLDANFFLHFPVRDRASIWVNIIKITLLDRNCRKIIISGIPLSFYEMLWCDTFLLFHHSASFPLIPW